MKRYWVALMNKYYLSAVANLYKLDQEGIIHVWTENEWADTKFKSNDIDLSRVFRWVTEDDLKDYPAFVKERFYRELLSDNNS